MESVESVVELFQDVEPPVRLELLLDYAGKLPPLPESYRALRDAGLDMVHECQAPVFLHIGMEDGRVAIHADVPEEAPTARGFTSLLIAVFDGASPNTVAEAPPDMLHALRLTPLLGMQRTRGLSAIYRRLRTETARLAEAPPS